MVFSSNLFLYHFFPPVVFLHTLALIVFPKSTAPANATLLLVSILLYYWGNGPTVVLLGLTILITAGIGHKISVSSAQSGLRLLWIGAGLNLLALFITNISRSLRDCCFLRLYSSPHLKQRRAGSITFRSEYHFIHSWPYLIWSRCGVGRLSPRTC